MRFVAIDFTTANRNHASTCAIAATRITNTTETSTHWFVQPARPHHTFDPHHTRHHRISQATVTGSPDATVAIPELIDFIGNDPVITWGAQFDIRALRATCYTLGLTTPDLTYWCTQTAARRAYRTPQHSLAAIAEHTHAPTPTPGDTESYTRAAAHITQHMATTRNATTLKQLADITAVTLGHCGPEGNTPSYALTPLPSTTWPEPNPDAHTNHPLYGANVAFGSALITLTRHQAAQRVANVGGIPQQRFTKTTTVVVTGPASHTGAWTAIETRARNAALTGRRIQFITEDDLITLTSTPGSTTP